MLRDEFRKVDDLDQFPLSECFQDLTPQPKLDGPTLQTGPGRVVVRINQEVTLALRLRRVFFDSLLALAVPSSWDQELFTTKED